MATFGNTTAESGWNVNQQYYYLGGLFTLSEAGTVSKISAYLRNTDSGHYACNAYGLIYNVGADNAHGGSLVVASASTAIADNQAAGWQDFTFASPPALSPANYWLVMLGNGQAMGLAVAEVADAGEVECILLNEAYTVDDPLGAVTNAAVHVSIYATYTATAAGNPYYAYAQQ